jgi:hypothetical protein
MYVWLKNTAARGGLRRVGVVVDAKGSAQSLIDRREALKPLLVLD